MRQQQQRHRQQATAAAASSNGACAVPFPLSSLSSPPLSFTPVFLPFVFYPCLSLLCLPPLSPARLPPLSSSPLYSVSVSLPPTWSSHRLSPLLSSPMEPFTALVELLKNRLWDRELAATTAKPELNTAFCSLLCDIQDHAAARSLCNVVPLLHYP